MSQRILISGASRGIGAALLDIYRSDGATAFGFGRTVDKASSGLWQCDARTFSKDDIPTELCTGIDTLILNHAVFGPAPAQQMSMSAEKLADILDINVVSQLRVLRACLDALRESDCARVLFVISKGGLQREMKGVGALCYRTTKAAQIALALTVAKDPELMNITVALVNPGHVRTRLGGKAAPRSPEESARDIVALVRDLSPEDNGGIFDYDGSVIRV